MIHFKLKGVNRSLSIEAYFQKVPWIPCASSTVDTLVDRTKVNINRIMREVIKILKRLGNECIAELIGTLILCGFGNASIAVFILAPQNLSSSLSVHFSWGLGKQLFNQLLVRRRYLPKVFILNHN